MWLLSCACLAFVTAACIAGVLTRSFDDNLVQRVGLAVLGIGTATRVQEVWVSEFVRNDWLLVHGGMALVAAGTAWKVAADLRRARTERPGLTA